MLATAGTSMAQMEPTWSLSALWLPIALLILVEEVGLKRLRDRASLDRSTRWRYRGWAYEAGLVALGIIDSSPLMGLGMKHLSIHMVVHVIEMFYIPVVLIVGAPWLPALFSLPVALRRRVLRWWYLGRARWLTRQVGVVWTAPVFGLVLFNATMVFWHLPVTFDWAGQHMWAHTWLMMPSFVITGYLFWRIIIPSHPYAARGTLKLQALSVAVTAFAMVILAIAMAVMSTHAWYSINVEMLGASGAFSDQQLAAGILWICGDFWAPLAIIVIVRRVISRHGGLSEAFERSVGRVAA